MQPVIPHLATECLEMLGFKDCNNNLLWPKVDNKFLIKENIKFIIQINGKTRNVLEIKIGQNEEMIMKIVEQDQKLKNHLNKKIIKNTIFIKDKLINIITE